MKKSISCVLLSLIFVGTLLAACTPAVPNTDTTETTTQAPQPQYAGTLEGYEYFHTNQRDRAWEEDVLVMADEFLTNHPYLANNKVYSYTWTFEGTFRKETVAYDHSRYDAALREKFIAGINTLIAHIPQLRDGQIVFECQRLVAMLEDIHSLVNATGACTARLPIGLQEIGNPDGYDYYVSIAASEFEHLLYAKLISINGVSARELLDALAVYVSAQSDGRRARYVGSKDEWMIQKEALETIGVVSVQDTEAEVVLELDGATYTLTMPFATDEAYSGIEITDGRLSSRTDLPRYRYKGLQYYWYEILQEDTLYIRFSKMSNDPNYPFATFLRDITVALRSAEQPMRVIVDFRDNGGGSISELTDLAVILNSYASEEVYLLIDEGSVSSGVTAPYSLMQTVPCAQLVGTPAAQPPCGPSSGEGVAMPNSGIRLYASYCYIQMLPEVAQQTLTPDILVYPTIEDYRNGVDTVLEYVLALK